MLRQCAEAAVQELVLMELAAAAVAVRAAAAAERAEAVHRLGCL